MSDREMVCPYCKHRVYTNAPDPVYCGPHLWVLWTYLAFSAIWLALGTGGYGQNGA